MALEHLKELHHRSIWNIVHDNSIENLSLEDFLISDYLDYKTLPSIVDIASLCKHWSNCSYSKARNAIINTNKSYKINNRLVVSREDLIKHLFSDEEIAHYEERISELIQASAEET